MKVTRKDKIRHKLQNTEAIIRNSYWTDYLRFLQNITKVPSVEQTAVRQNQDTPTYP